MPSLKREKKGGLTLEKLASYDDVITDALVDKIYYWTTIRKNRGGRFTASRGLHEEAISDIIRQRVIWGKDVAGALQLLLQLPGLRKFMANLKDPQDQDQFRRHLKRYTHMYMPDCPFEVTTTNRYTITDHEASITARREIKPREEIKYLTGVQVVMTEEQEKVLELARKDFSLVISSRKKTRSLFLGPARFANHDCDANAKLSTKGVDGMQIVAVKSIAQGEEITVSYGEDYFGEDNEECLCHTCERRLQNGWAPLKRVEKSDDDEEEDEEDEDEDVEDDLGVKQKGRTRQQIVLNDAPVSRKRSYEASTECGASINSIHSKRIKAEQCVSLLRQVMLETAHSTSSLEQQAVLISSIEAPATGIPASSHQRDHLNIVSLSETGSSREMTPQSSLAGASPKSSHSTDATSVDGDHPTESNVMQSQVEQEVLHEKRSAMRVFRVKGDAVVERAKNPSPPSRTGIDDMSDLSELSSNLEFDSESEQLVKRKRQSILRTTRSRSRLFEMYSCAGTPISAEPDDDKATYVENARKPGDYMTSNSLLSAKYSKWVECQTCEDQFVQQDGYNTRKECPRCERHSKLYGFAWPKTERDGKRDREERIKDHRTVHRFVDPNEERQLKKAKTKKAIRQVIRETFSTPSSGRDSTSASVEVDSGRLRRRTRRRTS